MIEINTSELIGPALDWIVAECERINPTIKTLCPDKKYIFCLGFGDVYSPSSNWSQAGPIIEREGIDLSSTLDSDIWQAALVDNGEYKAIHSGPVLIAAMRCYVASKLGDVVSVPEELI